MNISMSVEIPPGKSKKDVLEKIENVAEDCGIGFEIMDRRTDFFCLWIWDEGKKQGICGKIAETEVEEPWIGFRKWIADYFDNKEAQEDFYIVILDKYEESEEKLIYTRYDQVWEELGEHGF